MAEREKFGQADETLVDKAGGGWSATAHCRWLDLGHDGQARVPLFV